jgi:acyl phosphate:glycerol-3-phosphate acyltransferase
MADYLWVIVSFLCGSLPFSIWMGKLFLGLDIRQYGDGNPGATNVIKAGSPPAGIIVLLLDVGKAALPVGYCYYNLNIRGFTMILVALAPILGHMFSPFLGWRGGKALAATLGVWIGLTIWTASLAAVAGVVLGIIIFSSTGWAVMLSMGMIAAVQLVWIPDPLFGSIWIGVTLLLAWTHRDDLRHKPALRLWLTSLFRKTAE